MKKPKWKLTREGYYLLTAHTIQAYVEENPNTGKWSIALEGPNWSDLQEFKREYNNAEKAMYIATHKILRMNDKIAGAYLELSGELAEIASSIEY